MDKRITVGFVIPGDGKWNGGINYLRNVIATIVEHLPQLDVRLFVAPDQRMLAEENFAGLLETPAIVDPRVVGAGSGRRALSAVLTGRDRAFGDLVTEAGVDVIFETAKYYGHRFPVPVLSWIPDFQHRHLPHLFSRAAWWKRELGFQAQTRSGRVILLSSFTAQSDCIRFYPIVGDRTRVARFVAPVPLAPVIERSRTVRADHDVPHRFFFLPNQFWEHKNHLQVLDALTLEPDLPPVIMTGSARDPRNPDLFDKIMGRAADLGLAARFRHLGMIPYLDVLALNMMSLAVLNPSRFEGWASSVEEAKAMKTPLVISDIPVHREQAPEGRFFPLDDPHSLARALSEAATHPPRSDTDLTALAAGQTTGNTRFAEEFWQAILACLPEDWNDGAVSSTRNNYN